MISRSQHVADELVLVDFCTPKGNGKQGNDQCIGDELSIQSYLQLACDQSKETDPPLESSIAFLPTRLLQPPSNPVH